MNQIIYANPCKSESQIQFAKSVNAKLMVFDSIEEAEKIVEIYPTAELVLRMAVEETDAPCPMGKKFGAPEVLWEPIVKGCKKLKANLVGVSFHVGSGGCQADVYRTSMLGARKIFDMAKKNKMPELTLLDIGGGFAIAATCDKHWNVMNTENNFEFVAPKIMDYVAEIFP